MKSARTAAAVIAVLLAAVTAAVGGPATSAGAADATTAVVRAAHFSPDTPGVDVYLQSYSGGATSLWLSDVGYGDVSAYQRLQPGVYVVAMRPHGAAATTPPAVSWTIDAKGGTAYTAAAVGVNAALQAVVLVDDLGGSAPDTGRVRVVQGSSRAASVSVTANGGTSLASKLAFGSTTDYQAVPSGSWTVQATPDSGSVPPATGSLQVPAGSSSTIVVADATNGGIQVLSVLDSAATGVVPAGGVEAGAGGTAAPATGPWPLVAVGAVGVLAAGLLARRTRRRVTAS